MKKLMFVIAILLPSILSSQTCLQADVILLGDYSNSISGHERNISVAFEAFVNEFTLSEEGIKIGAIAFASSTQLVQELSSDKKRVLESIKEMVYFPSSGTTDLTSGLYRCMEEFILNGRKNFRKIIILVSDGQPDEPNDVRLLVKRLELNDVQIYGVGIGDVIVDEYLESICCKNCYVHSNWNDLPKQIKKLDICF